ncbi:MAG: hypothetical protein WC501_04335 [Candidatus Micrarchaeia archaeon]
MEYKLAEIPVYKMHFGPNGPMPIVETQLIFREDISQLFQSKENMREDIIKDARKTYGKTKSETSTREISGKVGKDETVDQTVRTQEFSVSYENPITHELETLNITSQSIITDIENPIDETIAAGSTYPIYKYIASPIFSTQIYKEWIDEGILNDIRKKVELASPGPYGAGSVIPIMQVIKKDIKTAEKIRIETARERIIESVKRGELVNEQIEDKIAVLEYIIEALGRGESLTEILKNVPDNIRTLILIQLKKRKKINNEIIIEMLIENIGFLKELKKKLGKMDVSDLVGIAKSIKKIAKKR